MFTAISSLYFSTKFFDQKSRLDMHDVDFDPLFTNVPLHDTIVTNTYYRSYHNITSSITNYWIALVKGTLKS